MADSTKFAEFTKTAQGKLELVKSGLLRHEKNPGDREFINDILRSIRSIKNASLPQGLGRVSELCFHLENMLGLIRRNRVDIDKNIIDIITVGRDRLKKLVHEVDTMQQERATIKDLVKRIKSFEDSSAEEQTLETAPALEIFQTELSVEEEEPDLSLLPDEIKNEEYDKELFQIFVDQMQENLSLLRSLTDNYPEDVNKAKTLAICSDLVGKLQTSANYMGYDALAAFYLQWIAELEMAGVDFSIGSPVSIEFMDANLRKITTLFPQINDVPAQSDLVKKARDAFKSPSPAKKEPLIPEESEGESFRDFFSDMDSEIDIFDPDSDPVAALTGVESGPAKPSPEPAEPEPVRQARKKLAKAAPVEIDAGFIEEEKESGAFDEELFQIFLQQLQENLSQLRSLTDSYPDRPNKSRVVDLCSNLVDKLQSSAHYMGYERLAEFHLQWIAELELAGVELALGNDISVVFMDEKIKKIAGLFPEVEDVPADSSVMELLVEQSGQSSPGETGKEAPAPEHGEFKDFFSTVAESESTIFSDEDPEKAAEDAGVREAPAAIGNPSEEINEEDFLDELNRQTAAGETAVAEENTSESEDDDFLFGEFDEGEEESFEFDAEPIAALSEESIGDEDIFAEPPEQPVEPAENQEPEEDIEELFQETESRSADILEPDESGPESSGFEEDDDFFTDFAVEDEQFDISSSSIDAMSEEDGAPDAEETDSETGRKAEKPTIVKSAADDIEALFGDSEDEEEPFLAGEESDGTEPAPVRKELYRKLSHALKSLDEESETESVGSEKELKSTAGDADLYEKLIGALESTSEDDATPSAKPLDQVIEEILGSEGRPVLSEPVYDSRPLQFGKPEMQQTPGLDAAIINDLVNRIGELVANRSSFSRLHTDMETLQQNLQGDDELNPQSRTALQQMIARLGQANANLGRVSSEIKDGILKIRLTPVSHLFDLYAQTLPDFMHETGKKVDFTAEGGETEIDHCIIEDIATCLLILISNALEHGIETPTERAKAGKDEQASIALKAYQDHNHMILEVTDDGRGIDPKKIKAVALSRDMFSGDDLYKMTDNELTSLIMTPEFSTLPAAGTAQNGAGMDTVKDIIEKLKGSIQIKSSVGKGTTILLRVPQNLPIFKVLKYSDPTGSYAIPLTCVEEVVRLRSDDLVQAADGSKSIIYRGDTIPTVSMAEMLDTIVPATEQDTRFYGIVVSTDSGRMGLAVTAILGMEEVNIKPLADFIRTQSGFAAAAIGGKEEMSFIPDIAGLMEKGVGKSHTGDSNGSE